jgi:hypothetical protein
MSVVPPGQFLVASANVEGWAQVGELGLALVLSAAVGLEREVRGVAAANIASGSPTLLGCPSSAETWEKSASALR